MKRPTLLVPLLVLAPTILFGIGRAEPIQLGGTPIEFPAPDMPGKWAQPSSNLDGFTSAIGHGFDRDQSVTLRYFASEEFVKGLEQKGAPTNLRVAWIEQFLGERTIADRTRFNEARQEIVMTVSRTHTLALETAGIAGQHNSMSDAEILKKGLVRSPVMILQPTIITDEIVRVDTSILVPLDPSNQALRTPVVLSHYIMIAADRIFMLYVSGSIEDLTWTRSTGDAWAKNILAANGGPAAISAGSSQSEMDAGLSTRLAPGDADREFTWLASQIGIGLIMLTVIAFIAIRAFQEKQPKRGKRKPRQDRYEDDDEPPPSRRKVPVVEAQIVNPHSSQGIKRRPVDTAPDRRRPPNHGSDHDSRQRRPR